MHAISSILNLYKVNIFLYFPFKGFLLLKATSTFNFSLNGLSLFFPLLDIIITLK